MPPQCNSNADCSGSTPFCNNHTCTAGCVSEADCAANPGHPVCTSDGSCTACTASSQCPASAPVCDMSSGDCVGDNGSGAADAPSPCVDELVFQRGELFDSPQVFRVRLDDYIEHAVSNGTDTDMYPAWSPDGSRIALVRNGSSLWTVDPSGSNGHQVDSQSNVFLNYPVWSPDGQRLAYGATPTGTGSSRVYSADVTGSTGTNLTPANDGEAPVAWSPDGTTIAYESNQTGNLDLWLMAANGSNQRNLSNRSGSDAAEGAHWSPDGSQLVFGGGNHIWIIGKDGTGLQNLTGTANVEDQPWWASTGTIFYVKSPTASAQILSMNANGTNQHPIESDPAIDERPVPSPDGTKVAWVSYRDGNAEIYVANADGSNPTRVTNNTKKDLAPRWRPCAR